MKFLKLFSGVLLCSVCLSFTTSNWVLFETKDCKISFPKEPSDEQQTVNTAIGKLLVHNYMYAPDDSVKDDNLVYGLSLTEYPDSLVNSDKTEILEGFFRKSIDGAVNNVHGKLLTETDVPYHKFPGKEIKVDFKEGLAVIKMRFYLVKNKMYILQTITLTENDFNKSVDKFFDSFALKDIKN